MQVFWDFFWFFFEKNTNITHKQNIEETVKELINYALNLPLYFRKYNWEKAEDKADKEIAFGKTKSFDTIDDFIIDLEK